MLALVRDLLALLALTSLLVSGGILLGLCVAMWRHKDKAGGEGPSRKEVASGTRDGLRLRELPTVGSPVAPPPAERYVELFFDDMKWLTLTPHRPRREHMDREPCSQPIEASDDSWAALKLLGKITVAHDELEDSRL